MQDDNQRWRVLNQAVQERKPEFIIEVGVLRADTEGHRLGDGHATAFFAEYLEANPGVKYVGIDIDPAAIELSERLFAGTALKFQLGDACELLKQYNGQVDFLYLDGSDLPEETVKQFLVVNTPTLRTVVIDDTYQHTIKNELYWIGKGAGLVYVLQAMDWRIVPGEDYMVMGLR